LDFLFNRGGFGERAGTLGLRTIAHSAKFPILPMLDNSLDRLEALGREPEPEPELPDEDEEEDDGEPRYRATPEGTRAIHLAGMTELWLMESPEGELRWGEERARNVTLGLVDGWASTVVHRLAAEPLTLDELDTAILHLDRDEIEPCLETMSRDGQVELRAGRDGVDSYALTEWGRRGIASLIASARLEQTAGEGDPIEDIDVQAAFGLSLPLLRLRGDRSGSCALTVDLGGLDDPRPAEVTAGFEEGRLAAWAPGGGEDADTRISGGVEGWFRAVIEGRLDGLAAEGEVRLASAVLEGLHAQLFALED
jgi:hypothetical protein